METLFKIALYKTSYGSFIPMTQKLGEFGGDIQVSDFIEVDFKPLPHEQILSKELDLIDKAEEELKAKYHKAQEELQERRNQLLCITHQP